MYLNVHIHMYIGFSFSLSKSLSIFFLGHFQNSVWSSTYILKFCWIFFSTFPSLHCMFFFVHSYHYICFLLSLFHSAFLIYFPNVFLPHSASLLSTPYSPTFIFHKLLILLLSDPTYPIILTSIPD